MKLIYILMGVVSLCLAGCTELSAINQKVGDLAGKINKTLGIEHITTTQDEVVSKRDIDTLYVRIKRNIGFQTMEEMLKCDPQANKICAWRKSALAEGGYTHEKTPGVYYRMADSFGSEGQNYVDVTLEKEGKNSKVYWKVKGTAEFAEQVKSNILKSIK